ncbi:MAG: hypothetical protein OXH36_01155 [Bdellovibrionales bacterium]|nr:hypothetical protein [Bdellovibrionales bacterium]
MSKDIFLKRSLSKRERKEAFSPKSTERIVQVMKKAIKDKRVRKEIISMIRALDLKKIRNTSET